MLLSVLLAGAGLLTARHFYITQPELPRGLAAKWPGLHALLRAAGPTWTSSIIRPSSAARSRSAQRPVDRFDNRVVDGIGQRRGGSLTQIAAWVSRTCSTSTSSMAS